MIDLARTLRVVATLGALAALPMALAGCAGGEGVQFEGKIFEAVGLAGDGAGQKVEPKTQPRAPLVLPPDAQRLPDPGSVAAPVIADQQWPVDRDARRVADADARKAQQKKYCEDGNWKDKAHRKEIEAAKGPHGSCNGDIFSFISKNLTNGASE
ncbi:MAG: hypothetical protein ACKVP7_27870 [Hyphomicrobiaceae bacterium]